MTTGDILAVIFAALWVATMWVLWVVSGAAVREQKRAEEYKHQGGKMIEHYFRQVKIRNEFERKFNEAQAELKELNERDAAKQQEAGQ